MPINVRAALSQVNNIDQKPVKLSSDDNSLKN
jgi:hypothetical protein